MTAHRTDWVQPILVDKSGTHAGTVLAAALASVEAWHMRTPAQYEAFRAWLSGPFTKTVRRVSAGHLQRAADELDGTLREVDGARALALAPVRMGDLPRPVARAQVSGTDFARTLTSHGDGRSGALIVLDSLTTGKAAAQAAHALFAWALITSPARVHDVLSASRPPSVAFRSAAQLDATVRAYGELVHPICDNGLTEVEPGTLTAVYLPVEQQHTR